MKCPNKATERFAVVGNPIAHSQSPDIHQTFAEITGIKLVYEKVLSQSLKEDLPLFIDKYTGVNVTTPYKFDAASMCNKFGDNLAGEDARTSGAANTLHFKNHLIIGYNTDGIGFVRDINSHDITLTNKTVLILGAGGACAGIIPAVLRERPRQIYLVNRTFAKADIIAKPHPIISAITLEALNDNKTANDISPNIIINTTSAGLTGQRLKLPSSLFRRTKFIYDLNYNSKRRTPFLTDTEHFRIAQADGYGMLIEQARESFHIWHGVLPK